LNTQDDGAALALDRAPDLRWIEAPVHDDRPTCAEDRDQKCRQSAGVIHRREDWTDVVVAQSPVDGGVVAIPVELAPRDHYALRLAGGARGVEEAVRVLVIGGWRLPVAGCRRLAAMPYGELPARNG